jgi:hypothetical protein
VSVAVPQQRRAARGRLPAVGRAVAPLLGYLVLSILYFGWPVLGRLDSAAIAQDEFDSSAYMWFLAWWPHAVLHGLNPFVTHAIFVPEGYNLTWVTSIPGPAIVLAPVTLLFGPVVAFNVLQLLSPALSAWGGFALCRYVTHAVWPSVVGGYLFGFSPYMLNELRGTPNLTLVALVPILVLLVLMRVNGALPTRRFVVLMTACLVCQFLTSTEVLAMTTLFGGFGLVAAWVLFTDRRAVLTQTAKLLAVSYAAAGVVLTPYLAYFLFASHTTPQHTNPRLAVLDVNSFFVPGELEWHGREQAQQWGKHGIGWLVGGSSYLGLPLIAILIVCAWQRRRDRGTQLLLLCLLVCVVASLGPRLILSGRPRFVLPWELFVHAPLFRYALPERFALYSFLVIALIVSTWLAQRPSMWRWALAGLAVLALLPEFGSTVWRSTATEPGLFAGDGYKAYLRPADHVLTVPTWGRNERWQARTGFGFKIVGGYVGQSPSSYTRYPTWRTLRFGGVTRDYARQVRAFVAAKKVTVIVVDKRMPGNWRWFFAPLGVRPIDTGGVLIYRLAPPGGAPRPAA